MMAVSQLFSIPIHSPSQTELFVIWFSVKTTSDRVILSCPQVPLYTCVGPVVTEVVRSYQCLI